MTSPSGVTASPSQPGYQWSCDACGKSLSNAQAIFYLHHVYCLDDALYRLGNDPDDLDGHARVDISVDYLQRMRDGVV